MPRAYRSYTVYNYRSGLEGGPPSPQRRFVVHDGFRELDIAPDDPLRAEFAADLRMGTLTCLHPRCRKVFPWSQVNNAGGRGFSRHSLESHLWTHPKLETPANQRYATFLITSYFQREAPSSSSSSSSSM